MAGKLGGKIESKRVPAGSRDAGKSFKSFEFGGQMLQGKSAADALSFLLIV